jgi:hypothetical protein
MFPQTSREAFSCENILLALHLSGKSAVDGLNTPDAQILARRLELFRAPATVVKPLRNLGRGAVRLFAVAFSE